MPSEIHVGDGSHSCTHLVPTIVGKLVPVALFVVLISVACSSSAPVADPTIDSTNSVEPTPTPQSIVETTDISQNSTAVSPVLSDSSTFDDDRYGGVLRIEYIGDFIPDPVVGSNPEDRFFYAEMYSGLTRISGDPSATVETELAESYSVSDWPLRAHRVRRLGRHQRPQPQSALLEPPRVPRAHRVRTLSIRDRH